MKKLLAALLVLAMLLCGAALGEEGASAVSPFVGEWNEERISAVIWQTGEDFLVTISGSNGATESTVWIYPCVYDADTDSLVCTESGRKADTTIPDEFELPEEALVYSDGSAVFTIDLEGRLRWEDKKEGNGEGRAFDKAPLTLGSCLDLAVERPMSMYNGERYVCAFMLAGVPLRVTAAMTEEISEACMNATGDDAEEQIRSLIADLPIVNVEDLSAGMISQADLDALVGCKGSELLAQGFTPNGYTYSEDETCFFLENGLFEYSFDFEETLGDDVEDPYALLDGMTVKAARCDGISYNAVSSVMSDAADGESLLTMLFGGLYSSVPQPQESPDWVKNLPQAQDENTRQLFVVAGLGMDKTTATVSMHMRDEEGRWMQYLSTPGFVGKNGLCPDADHKEGCGQTPIGVYRFNKAFGIAPDVGCSIPYTQVDEYAYWSGDPERQYNQMVDIREVPELALADSEHIVDYDYQYRYCLNISFNEEGTPGRGSAIFLHCFGPLKPYTGGCVAIPENIMQLVMMTVTEDCVVVIDTLDNLGGSL